MSGPVVVKKNTWVNDFPDFYKIGIAEDPEARLSSMQSGTPHELRLLTTIGADDARAVEKSLHSLLRNRRHRAEWFELTSKKINSLKAIDYMRSENISKLAKRSMRYELDYEKGLYVQLMELRKGGGDE